MSDDVRTTIDSVGNILPLSWPLRALVTAVRLGFAVYFPVRHFVDSLRADDKRPTLFLVAEETDRCEGCPSGVATEEVEVGLRVYRLCRYCAGKLA